MLSRFFLSRRESRARRRSGSQGESVLEQSRAGRSRDTRLRRQKKGRASSSSLAGLDFEEVTEDRPHAVGLSLNDDHDPLDLDRVFSMTNADLKSITRIDRNRFWFVPEELRPGVRDEFRVCCTNRDERNRVLGRVCGLSELRRQDPGLNWGTFDRRRCCRTDETFAVHSCQSLSWIIRRRLIISSSVS